jgi:starvation-inducible DNA-binding protein
MIQNLVRDQEIITETIQGLIDAADDADDDATEDLAIARMQVHQKHHWMLKAHLE